MKKRRTEPGNNSNTQEPEQSKLPPPRHVRRDVFDAFAAEDPVMACMLEYVGAIIVTDDHLGRRPRKPMYVYQYRVDKLRSEGPENLYSELIDRMMAEGALAIIGSSAPNSTIGVGLKTCSRCLRDIPIDANFCCYCSKECFG